MVSPCARGLSSSVRVSVAPAPGAVARAARGGWAPPSPAHGARGGGPICLRRQDHAEQQERGQNASGDARETAPYGGSHGYELSLRAASAGTLAMRTVFCQPEIP